MAAIKALELWCRSQCEGYRDVSITNMTTSFRSGLAFCALIHKFRPDLIDYDSLRKEDVFKNNSLAFRVAEEKLGIPALLDAEDMVALRIPDRLSILTYVSQYHNYFKGRPPMGGVKRPAEGPKEKPLRKNLPVHAETFVSKSTRENRSTPADTVQSSPKSTGAAALAEKTVLTENSNKSGTLNSKCAACKSHVHLVQRHFVDGRLYHRSCFVCSECSCVLHVGSYKAGKTPDTFVCKNHPSSGPLSSEVSVKKGPVTVSSGRATAVTKPQPAPHPSSVLLSAPPDVVLKPVHPDPPPHSWTLSAQRTQAARQKFFEVAQASTGTKVPARDLSPTADKIRARTVIGKKLAEENFNNNNKRPFTIRSAERRFGDEPAGLCKDKQGREAAGNLAGQGNTGLLNQKEAPGPKVFSRNDSTTPTAVNNTAKDAVAEWQAKLNPVKPQSATSDPSSQRQHKPVTTPPAPMEVPVSTWKPPLAPTSAGPIFVPAPFKDVTQIKPPHGLRSQVAKPPNCSPVKSPPKCPAVESRVSSSFAAAPPVHENSSGAKKGKYLSPTDASRTEMRSPSVRSCHIPLEQIEQELDDIETNLERLEREGVELEKKLRSCEEDGDGDILMDPLMVDWFNLIRKKQMYIRKESELVYIARTQELEQQQPGVEWELRTLMEKPDHLKSNEEKQKEKKLMQRLMEIVDRRNAIVEGLDEDRLREVEEDQQLNEMMRNLGVKKTKPKRKSSISKLFRRRSKRRVEFQTQIVEGREGCHLRALSP
ncbi:MICAL-like protein 2a isoform X1 [Synchiropus splendidus]|uniref:MICAL-like protein 2a isoform X1 n=2 Tax=Synchiropus splendidus TaxID=270530 RepID=UPI00237ED55C|nr:MICAL-like protein 2a isoform X1 [Synchiropus splendidus]